MCTFLGATNQMIWGRDRTGKASVRRAHWARKCAAPKMQRYVKGVLCVTQSQFPNVVRRSGRGPVEHGGKLGRSSRCTQAQCERSLVYARRLGVDICKHISDDRVIRE